jgi:hypothetical protein
MSGHRGSDDGRVVFNTFYDEALDNIESDAEQQRVAATFQLVIPIDKIVSASGFDFGAYERFGLAEAERVTASVGETPLPRVPGPSEASTDAVAALQWNRTRRVINRIEEARQVGC